MRKLFVVLSLTKHLKNSIVSGITKLAFSEFLHKAFSACVSRFQRISDFAVKHWLDWCMVELDFLFSTHGRIAFNRVIRLIFGLLCDNIILLWN